MIIGIIGMGWVGSSVAISILHEGFAREVWLNDLRPELAEAEAMDLGQGASFYPTCAVRPATVQEMAAAADAVVIAAGRGGRPGESRLDLLQETAEIARRLGEQLTSAEGLVVLVTNPVDVLTRIVVDASGLPASRVFGTGTMLDTARLRHLLGRRLSLDPRSVHAQVVGEHGDSQVSLFSSATVAGVPLRSWPGWEVGQEPVLEQQVRGAAAEIIARKGATNHAIGLVTARLLAWALRGTRRVLTVSRVQQGALGLDGVALSLPAIVGTGGAESLAVPKLDDREQQRLVRSAELLDAAYRSVSRN